MQAEFDGPELILRFDNLRPIKAGALARVLKDLASDYKRLYRDDLVIVALPQGSLIAKLRAFSKFSESANHILDFAHKLSGIMVGLAGIAIVQGAISDRADTPLKAAQSLAALAVQSHSHLELRYLESGKQEIILNITPDQATTIEQNAKEKARRASPRGKPLLAGYDEPALLASRATDYGTLKQQLAQINQRPGGFANLDPDVRKLIVALVLELNRTSPLRVSQLARELESEGAYDAATLIRQIVGTDGGSPLGLLQGRWD